MGYWLTRQIGIPPMPGAGVLAKATSAPLRFGRHPDMDKLRVAVGQARDMLDQTLCMGIHATAFPARPDRDTGVGTPFSDDALQYLQYVRDGWGVTHIQLGPMGLLSRSKGGGDLSPYTGTAFSRNPLLVDLFQLTTPAFGNLLEPGWLKSQLVDIKKTDANTYEWGVSPKNTNFDILIGPYGFLQRQYDKAFTQAYDTLKAAATPEAQKLKQDFEAFKQDPTVRYWLETDALYDVLVEKVYGGEGNWRSWTHPDHQHLMWDADSADAALRQKAQATRQGLEQQYAGDLDRYRFKQFLFHKQLDQFKSRMAGLGLKLVGDLPIAFSHRDVWAHRDLFLEGNRAGQDAWRLGNENPNGGSPQKDGWNFPALNLDRIYQPDGSMTPQAKGFFTAVFDKFFRENPGGGRIDHVRGWITPWVYQTNPAKGKNLPDLFPHLPQDRKLTGLMREMLISAQRNQVNRIVVEDLGDTTPAAMAQTLASLKASAMKDFGIVMGSMKPLRYYNPNDMDRHPFHPNQVAPTDQYFVTSHDGETMLQLFKGLGKKFQQFLSGMVKGSIQPHEIANFPARFMEAMLATLFLRPQKQAGIKQEAFAYFQDLHGYGHQLNGSLMFNNFHQPGHPNNWRLRIFSDYKGEWESRIQNHEIPSPAAVWKTALQAKGQGQSATAKTLQDLDTIFKSK